jgi:hypothetical protein
LFVAAAGVCVPCRSAPGHGSRAQRLAVGACFRHRHRAGLVCGDQRRARLRPAAGGGRLLHCLGAVGVGGRRYGRVRALGTAARDTRPAARRWGGPTGLQAHVGDASHARRRDATDAWCAKARTVGPWAPMPSRLLSLHMKGRFGHSHVLLWVCGWTCPFQVHAAPACVSCTGAAAAPWATRPRGRATLAEQESVCTAVHAPRSICTWVLRSAATALLCMGS